MWSFVYLGRYVENGKRLVFFVIRQTVNGISLVILLENRYLVQSYGTLQTAAVDLVFMTHVAGKPIGMFVDRIEGADHCPLEAVFTLVIFLRL